MKWDDIFWKNSMRLPTAGTFQTQNCKQMCLNAIKTRQRSIILGDILPTELLRESDKVPIISAMPVKPITSTDRILTSEHTSGNLTSVESTLNI